jgi:methyl-accepting chemotaxis protein
LVTGWVSVVTALSVAIIALVMVATAVAQLVLIRRLAGIAPSLQRLLDTLDRDAKPALQSARTAADEATKIAIAVRGEVDSLVGTSKDVRQRVQRAVRSAEDRLLELEDILDILQDEVEETVLSVAGTLRATRRGASVFAAMKRAFLGGGR